MTTLDKKEIRGITLPLLWAFIVGTVSVCGTVIWGVSKVQSTMALHEYRITNAEKEVTALKTWREKVTSYYLPNQNQQK